jgi:flagellar hook-basal body complex protein FliE
MTDSKKSDKQEIDWDEFERDLALDELELSFNPHVSSNPDNDIDKLVVGLGEVIDQFYQLHENGNASSRFRHDYETGMYRLDDVVLDSGYKAGVSLNQNTAAEVREGAIENYYDVLQFTIVVPGVTSTVGIEDKIKERFDYFTRKGFFYFDGDRDGKLRQSDLTPKVEVVSGENYVTINYYGLMDNTDKHIGEKVLPMTTTNSSLQEMIKSYIKIVEGHAKKT